MLKNLFSINPVYSEFMSEIIIKNPIIILESPFQIIQFVELKQRYECLDDSLVIRLNGKRNNDFQMLRLINVFNLKPAKTIVIDRLFKKIMAIPGLIWFACKHDQMIFGDSNSYIFRFLKLFFRPSSIILLDDGVATLNGYKTNYGYKHFSIFENISADVVKNDFRMLRKQLISEDSAFCHIIIGGDLVESMIIDKACYGRALEKLLNNLGNPLEPVYYIPHRGEDENNLSSLAQEHQFSILETDLPIEIIGIEKKLRPKSISSIFSTALFTLPLIYEDVPVYIYELDTSNLLSRKSDIKNVYSEFRLRDVGIFV
jgi:hypothetical protein